MQIAANVPIIVVCIWQAYRIDYYNYLIGAGAYSLILGCGQGKGEEWERTAGRSWRYRVHSA